MKRFVGIREVAQPRQRTISIIVDASTQSTQPAASGDADYSEWRWRTPKPLRRRRFEPYRVQQQGGSAPPSLDGRRQQRPIRELLVGTAVAVALAGCSGSTSTMSETTTVTVTMTLTPPTVTPSRMAPSGGLSPIPGDGIYNVGLGPDDVQPGTYTSGPLEPGMHCFWWRFAKPNDGASGEDSASNELARGGSAGPVFITLFPVDMNGKFKTRQCKPWEKVP